MLKEKIVSFTQQCIRVWHLLRKPTTDEFKKVSMVSAIGLGLIGLIGFVTAILMNFLFQLLD